MASVLCVQQRTICFRVRSRPLQAHMLLNVAKARQTCVCLNIRGAHRKDSKQTFAGLHLAIRRMAIAAVAIARGEGGASMLRKTCRQQLLGATEGAHGLLMSCFVTLSCSRGSVGARKCC